MQPGMHTSLELDASTKRLCAPQACHEHGEGQKPLLSIALRPVPIAHDDHKKGGVRDTLVHDAHPRRVRAVKQHAGEREQQKGMVIPHASRIVRVKHNRGKEQRGPAEHSIRILRCVLI